MKGLVLKFFFMLSYFLLCQTQTTTTTSTTQSTTTSATPSYTLNPLPTLSTITTWAGMDSQMTTDFSDIIGTLFNGLTASCTDSRVSKSLSADDAYATCILYAYDFNGDYIQPYVANNYLCSGNGVASATKDSTGMADVKCACSSGWNGVSCAFYTRDYTYTVGYLNSFNTWVSGVSSQVITSKTEFLALLDITDWLTYIIMSLNNSDQNNYNTLFNNILKLVTNANVDLKDADISSALDYFFSSMISSSASSISDNSANSADTSDMLARTAASSGKTTNNNKYGATSFSSSSTNDSSFSFSRRNLEFLNIKELLKKRFLQISTKTAPTVKPSTVVPLTTKSPSCVIPKTCTAAFLPTVPNYSFSFVRDNKPYVISGQPMIQSSVVTIAPADSTTKKIISLPSGTSCGITLNVPVAYPPLTLASGSSFSANCKCYSYNSTAKTWTVISGCTVDNSSTSDMFVLKNIPNFYTYGVGCTGTKARIGGGVFIKISMLLLIFAIWLFF